MDGFAQKTMLFTQNAVNDCPVESKKLPGSVGLQLHSDLPAEHFFAPDYLECCWLQVVWIIPEELRRE
jgi:hypothetical protein